MCVYMNRSVGGSQHWLGSRRSMSGEGRVQHSGTAQHLCQPRVHHKMHANTCTVYAQHCCNE
jgi:hypothetical protein